eukprot:jgi/Mesvir1/9264/Mv03129-RA.1
MALLGSRPVTGRAGRKALRAGNVPLIGFICIIGLATVVIVLNLQRIRKHSTQSEVFYLDVRPSGHRWGWNAIESTGPSASDASVEIVLVHDPSDELDDVDALYKFLQQGQGLDVVDAANASEANRTVTGKENSTSIAPPVAPGHVSQMAAPPAENIQKQAKHRRPHRKAVPEPTWQALAAAQKKPSGQLDRAQIAEIFQELSGMWTARNEGEEGSEGEEGREGEEGGGDEGGELRQHN